MKAIGCLGVIALVVLVVLVLANTRDATDEQKAQWVGQKAHRGWNTVKVLARQTAKGWKTVPDSNQPARP
jgi:hypothetical protein